MTSSSTASTARRTATFLIRQQRQTQGFREEILAPFVLDNSRLGDPTNGGDLTMLWIPPGRFWMGSPQEDRDRKDTEGPPHLVQLQGFFMGQTPITQAQWQVVAQWQEREGEHWGRELRPNPSYFQLETPQKKDQEGRSGSFRLLEGESTTNQRPVESVSWEEAMEFCSRLSQRTGRTYTLPSEAQWEYACRAGTTTPFHFGDGIIPELANYDKHYKCINGCYGLTDSGRSGAPAWQQTTPVGMFPANAWGLQDMHGNVWEWCLDHWHANYEGAPVDGSVWLSKNLEEKDEYRLLRGGHWGDHPRYCRSSYRGHNNPSYTGKGLGFRVVCLPLGRASFPSNP